MRLSARLFALCLPLISLPALAAPVSGLYQVREAVTNQKLEGLAEGYLEELRAAAFIREP